MASRHYGVDNLTVLVDRNNLQVDGFVDEVMGIEPLLQKWRAFGWQAVELDGHQSPSCSRRSACDGRAPRGTLGIIAGL